MEEDQHELQFNETLYVECLSLSTDRAEHSLVTQLIYSLAQDYYAVPENVREMAQALVTIVNDENDYLGQKLRPFLNKLPNCVTQHFIEEDKEQEQYNAPRPPHPDKFDKTRDSLHNLSELSFVDAARNVIEKHLAELEGFGKVSTKNIEVISRLLKLAKDYEKSYQETVNGSGNWSTYLNTQMELNYTKQERDIIETMYTHFFELEFGEWETMFRAKLLELYSDKADENTPLLQQGFGSPRLDYKSGYDALVDEESIDSGNSISDEEINSALQNLSLMKRTQPKAVSLCGAFEALIKKRFYIICDSDNNNLLITLTYLGGQNNNIDFEKLLNGINKYLPSDDKAEEFSINVDWENNMATLTIPTTSRETLENLKNATQDALNETNLTEKVFEI